MFGKALETFEKLLITIGFAVATLLLFANVVLRYLFHTGLPWVLEAVQYLFAWVVLVGAAYGFHVGAHLGIDLLVQKFSPRNQRLFALFGLAVCLAFAGIVFYYSVIYTIKVYQWGDLSLDLEIPQWIPYLAIPVGLGLMIFHLLQLGWDIWQGRTTSLHVTEAAEAFEDSEHGAEGTGKVR